jgi:hypothetical protein
MNSTIRKTSQHKTNRKTQSKTTSTRTHTRTSTRTYTRTSHKSHAISTLIKYINLFSVMMDKKIYLWLSKPNILLIIIYVLSHIPLLDKEKSKFYELLAVNDNFSNSEVKDFFEIVNNKIRLYDIHYDNTITNITTFAKDNYANMLCAYNKYSNKKEEQYICFMNLLIILKNIFDDKCNLKDEYKTNTKVLKNIFSKHKQVLQIIYKLQADVSQTLRSNTSISSKQHNSTQKTTIV